MRQKRIHWITAIGSCNQDRIEPITQLVRTPIPLNTFPNSQNEKRALAIPLTPLFLLCGPTRVYPGAPDYNFMLIINPIELQLLILICGDLFDIFLFWLFKLI
jgi:hypothetical protein